MKIKSIINNLKASLNSYKEQSQEKNMRAMLNQQYVPMEGISGFTKDSQIPHSSSSEQNNQYTIEMIKQLSLPELLLLSDANFLGNDHEIKDIKTYISEQIAKTSSKQDTQYPPKKIRQNKQEHLKSNTVSHPKEIINSDVNIQSPAHTSNSSNSDFNYYRKKIINDKNTHSAFMSFAASPESIATYFNKKNLTIFINGIHHEDERSSAALKCKQFLNDNFKKQRIFFEILDNLSEGIVLANVYIDKEKKINIASLAEKYGFSHSSITPFDEDNLVIPADKVVPKYNNTKDINISDYSDSKVVNSQSPDSEGTPANLNNNQNPLLVPYFEKHLPSDKNQDIGLVLKFGKAPYLFDNSKSDSFYLTITTQNKEKTLWGIKLEDAIKKSTVYPGDFININKISIKNEKTGRTFYDWKINILEKSLDNELQQAYLSSLSPQTSASENTSSLDNKDQKNSIFDKVKSQDSNDISHNDSRLSFLFDDDENPFSSSKSRKP